jgi:hypothetical protein
MISPGTFQAVSPNCEKRLLVSSYFFFRPSVPMEQLGSNWTHFSEILFLRILSKSVEKIES